ncbi:MAG: right-handed parallel beta-helix repeat-containing protein [Gammaproteobacteria bacterium]|nr:right-handed parallel beta-helix repeat-containing protein [Gammaproteobacteria bacterium]
MFTVKNDSLFSHSRKQLLIGGLFVSLITILPSLANAATYYVSPTGSAGWNECTNINTPCPALTAMENAVAGDLVYFRGGKYELYYDTSKDGTQYYWYRGVLNPSNSGTENNPITFAAYPDEIPVLNCHTSTQWDDGDQCNAIGTGYVEYITVDGFKVQADDGAKMGRVIIWGPNTYTNRTRGITLKNTVIYGGTTVVTSTTNREGLRVDSTDGTLIKNVKIYSYRQVNNWDNTSCIKTYHNSNLIIEKSEFFNCSNGIFLKSDTDNSIVRYNYIHDNYIGMHVAAFLDQINTNGKIEHNVFAHNSRDTLKVVGEDGATSDNFEINNNTLYGPNGRWGLSFTEGANLKVWNNLIQGFPNNQYITGYTKLQLTESDHNQFGTSPLTIHTRYYQPNTGKYTSVTAWQNSGELANGANPGAGSMASDPKFVNASGTFTTLTDFELAQDSPSKGTGRNGADMGADIKLVGYKSNTIVPKPPLLY